MCVKIVTIVIYEHPAALDEINTWESKMHNKIKSIHRLKNNRIKYEMNSGEILVCYPNDDFGFKEVTEKFATYEYVFNKMLLFGKFDLFQIEKLHRIIITCLELKKNYV